MFRVSISSVLPCTSGSPPPHHYGYSPTWVALQMSRTCSLVSSIVAKYLNVVSRLL